MPLNPSLKDSKNDFSAASQGMRSPRVITLVEGQALFRFASTTNLRTGASIPSAAWAAGAWWMPEDSYRRIIARFQNGQVGLGTVARGAAAVQPSWSKMDVSVKARVVQDANAFIGKGKTQYRDQLPNGMFVTLKGWPDIDQIYLPHAALALKVVRQKIVTSNDFGFG